MGMDKQIFLSHSHPSQHLSVHLNQSVQLAKAFLDEGIINGIHSKDMEGWLLLAVACHDLGKGTGYFQKYIVADNKKGMKGKPEYRHSLLSSLITYNLVKKMLEQKGKRGRIIPFFLSLIVRRHHGNLNDIFLDASVEVEEIHCLTKQVESIRGEFLEHCLSSIRVGLPGEIAGYFNFSVADINTWIDNFRDELRQVRRELRVWQKTSTIEDYLVFHKWFSLLLDADKSQAITRDTTIIRNRRQIPLNAVDLYKDKQEWNSSSLNALREKAYRDVLDRDFDMNDKYFSLQLPTGMGKTLISLAFALKLRNLVYKTTGKTPRIIYALPFLSIIDQNYSVFQEVLKTAGVDGGHSIIIKHHCLSELVYKTDDNEGEYDYGYDVSKLLIEGWSSEIIVTTFIQLFGAILSNKNALIRKFHRLANSIIILDEVQSIPHRYWALMRAILTSLAENINCRIVFCTATDPILIPKEKTIPLIKDKSNFNNLNRVTLYPHVDEPVTIEDWVESLKLDSDKRYLFILNTIDSAKQLFKLLTKFVDTREIAFLSTHIIPLERIERIRAIREGKYRIVVSTQMVEAGVDIDFDVVFRDLAPFDSISQASGRANRNGLKSGIVHVVSLKNSKGKEFATSIYDQTRLELTRELLKRYKIIPENKFMDLTEEFFTTLSERINNSESMKIINAVKKLYYSGEQTQELIPITDFNLIEENYQKLDIFIEINIKGNSALNAFETWERYLAINDIKDPIERKKAYDQIKGTFFNYVISVPLQTKNKPPLVHGIYYVGKDSLSDYYDEITGFINEEVSLIW